MSKHLSNTEWGLVIGALATIDLTEFILGFFGVSEFDFFLVDSFLAMSLAFYMQMRGQSMNNNKRLIGLFTTWLVGLVGVGFGDFWWADGVYYMYLDKASAKLERAEAAVPGGQIAVKMVEQKNKNSNLQKQANSQMLKLETNKTQGQNNLVSFPRNSTYTPKQTPDQANRIEQQKKAREERQKREAELSQAQTRVYMEKNYKGGYEKYKANNEKSDIEWKAKKERDDKLKNARQSYFEEDKKLNGGSVDIGKAA